MKQGRTGHHAGMGVAAVAVAVLLTACAQTSGKGDPSDPPAEPVAATSADLAATAKSNVFFGHQSVGMNILDGVPAVFAAAGSQAPEIVQADSAPAGGPKIAHTYIGENGDPSGKIAAFAEDIRSGYGAWADTAFMKLCYVDVVGGTDVQSLFAEYKQTMAELEKEFPEVTFLHLTVPLTTQPGLKDRVKVLLGRGTDHVSDNVAREQFNALVRAEYSGTGRLLDVAALESTTPEGGRVSGDSDGQAYYALYEGFASDPGHLNATGAQAVATGMINVVGSNAEK